MRQAEPLVEPLPEAILDWFNLYLLTEVSVEQKSKELSGIVLKIC